MTLPQNPVLQRLTEADRFAYQSRRYSNRNLWIMKLPSGKLVLSTPSRDPIEIVRDLDHLVELLINYQDIQSHRIYNAERALERISRKITKEEEDEFSDLKINL